VLFRALTGGDALAVSAPEESEAAGVEAAVHARPECQAVCRGCSRAK
jgi:hypothetical protein